MMIIREFIWVSKYANVCAKFAWRKSFWNPKELPTTEVLDAKLQLVWLVAESRIAGSPAAEFAEPLVLAETPVGWGLESFQT